MQFRSLQQYYQQNVSFQVTDNNQNMHIDDLARRRQDALIKILARGLVLSNREQALIDGMIIPPKALIARVFHYDFQPRVSYDTTDMREDQIAEDNDYYTHCMPLAFVIKAGSELTFGGEKLYQGDIIRMYDRKTRTLVNPRHKAYYENKGSDSNAEQIGVAPSQFIHRIHEEFRERVFFIDPLKNPDLADFHTFNLPEPEIFGLFKNPEILLNDLADLD